MDSLYFACFPGPGDSNPGGAFFPASRPDVIDAFGVCGVPIIRTGVRGWYVKCFCLGLRSRTFTCTAFKLSAAFTAAPVPAGDCTRPFRETNRSVDRVV